MSKVILANVDEEVCRALGDPGVFAPDQILLIRKAILAAVVVLLNDTDLRGKP